MISTDLYQNIGNSHDDAVNAVDALLSGIHPDSIEPTSLYIIIVVCRSLLTRIKQESEQRK